MTPDAGGAGQCGIGLRLRTARERVGLTLTQAAEKLHVDAKSLVALEAEDFDSFGAPVFARGHIRRYSELVGEKTEDLVVMYNDTVRAALPAELTRLPSTDPIADLRKFAVPALFGLIGLLLLGVVWWVLKRKG
jgi:cytoskeleton protein RodZ